MKRREISIAAILLLLASAAQAQQKVTDAASLICLSLCSFVQFLVDNTRELGLSLCS